VVVLIFYMFFMMMDSLRSKIVFDNKWIKFSYFGVIVENVIVFVFASDALSGILRVLEKRQEK